MRKLEDLTREEPVVCFETLESLQKITLKIFMKAGAQGANAPREERDATERALHAGVNLGGELGIKIRKDYNLNLTDWLAGPSKPDSEPVPAKPTAQAMAQAVGDDAAKEIVGRMINTLPDNIKTQIGDSIKERLEDRAKEFLNASTELFSSEIVVKTRGQLKREINALLQIEAENGITVETIPAFSGLEYDFLRRTRTKEDFEREVFSRFEEHYSEGGLQEQILISLASFQMDAVFILSGEPNIHHSEIRNEKALFLREMVEKFRTDLTETKLRVIDILNTELKTIFTIFG